MFPVLPMTLSTGPDPLAGVFRARGFTGVIDPPRP
jgi:hypothetical protein